MKLFAIAAAGAVALSAVTPALAQTTVVKRTVTTTHHEDTDAPRTHWKRVCTVRWHHHTKVRTCRRTRVTW